VLIKEKINIIMQLTYVIKVAINLTLDGVFYRLFNANFFFNIHN